MPQSTLARFDARIPREVHTLLKRAAELEGRTMTDFVINAAQNAAQRAIEQAGVIRLSLEDQACFADALLSPAKKTPAMQRAFKRHEKLLRSE